MPCLPITAGRVRRVIAAMLAFCQLAMATGIPIPVNAAPAAQGDTQKYPCQQRGCGCRSAEKCWASCCCFSNEEKLAWAMANDVEPPPSFLKQLASERAATRQSAPPAAASACCCCKAPASNIGPAASSSATAPSEPTATPGSSTTAEQTATPDQAADNSDWQVEILLGIAAQRCQGYGSLAAAQEIPALPPEPRALGQAAFDPLDTLVTLDQSPPEHSLPPPVPPPRIA